MKNNNNMSADIRKMNFIKIQKDGYVLCHIYDAMDDICSAVKKKLYIYSEESPVMIRVKGVEYLLFSTNKQGIVADFICKPNSGKFELYKMNSEVIKEYQRYMVESIGIEEGNRLIADFMGIEFNSDGDKCNHPLIESTWAPIEVLKYHCDYSWLMPVVKKIITSPRGKSVSIGMENGRISAKFSEHEAFKADTLVKAMYLAVIDIIDYLKIDD